MSVETTEGDRYTRITTNATNQLKTSPGRSFRLLVIGAGTAWQIAIYDHRSASSNLVFTWVTADGANIFPLDIPMGQGLRVVSSGTTPGEAVFVWS